MRLYRKQFFTIEHPQTLYAVALSPLLELLELGEQLFLRADGQRADPLERNVQLLAHVFHHAVALDVEPRLERTVFSVIARVDDGAVRLAGARANVLVLFDHQYPRVIFT